MNVASWLSYIYPSEPPTPPVEVITTLTGSNAAVAAATAAAAAAIGTTLYCVASAGSKRAAAEPSQPPAKRQKRQITPTNANITITRDVDGNVDDAIYDHHQRRLLIALMQYHAYWNEKCRVWSSPTTHQHGCASGYKGKRQACHSGLNPEVNDDAAIRLRNQSRWLRSTRQLILMGQAQPTPCFFSVARLINTLFWVIKNLAPFETNEERHLAKRECIYAVNSFIHALANSTVLLEDVNRFDCCIEPELREKGIEFLNGVSQGEQPYNALVDLIKVIEEVLMEKKGYLKKVGMDLRILHSLEQELKRYENEWKQGRRPLKEYLELLGKVIEAQKQQDQEILWKYDTGALKATGRLPHHYVLQEKKLAPLYSKAKCNIKSAKTFNRRCKFLNEWASHLKGEATLHPAVERLSAIIEVKAKQEGSMKTHDEQSDWIDIRQELNSARKEFEESWKELKTALNDPYLCVVVNGNKQELMNLVQGQLAAAGNGWESPSLDPFMHILDRMEEVRQIYLDANVTPKPKELYGKRDGSLPSEEELMQIKETLFRTALECHGSPSS